MEVESCIADSACVKGYGHGKDHASKLRGLNGAANQTQRKFVSEGDAPVMGRLLSIPMNSEVNPLTANHVIRKDSFEAEIEFQSSDMSDESSFDSSETEEIVKQEKQ